MLPSRDGLVPKSLVASRQLSQRGAQALERADLASAEQLLAQAVKACPTDAEAHRHFAEVLWQQSRHAEALHHLDTAIQLSGEDARLVARLAQFRVEMAQWDLASEAAERAIALDPKLSAPWLARAQVRRHRGELRLALADYLRALSLVPGDRRALLETAELYRTMNQPEQALAKLQSLLETYPPGEEPHHPLYLQGLALAALERHDEAADAFRLAIDRGPVSGDVLYRLAEADYQAGRHENARHQAQRAVELMPDHPQARKLLDEILTARGSEPAVWQR